MNGHFAHPPPGFVFVPFGYNSPGIPGYFVQPHVQSQFAPNGAPYSPSSQTSHSGAYPAYSYPPPYMDPRTAPFRPQHPYPPYMPPPGVSGPPPPPPNYNGYYQPQHLQYPPAPPHPHYNHLNVPDHPPGLPIPHRLHPPPTGREPASATAREHEEINPYWKGRLAPLPGYRSEPVLLPTRKVKVAEQDGKEKENKEENKLELLPPTLSFEPEYQRPPPGLKKKSGKSKKNEKIEKPKEVQLDKFANIFVPNYLQEIQHDIHELKPLPALPIFPPESFFQSFLSPSLIQSVRPSNVLHALLSSPPLGPSEKKGLLPLKLEVYQQHWADILRWELDAMTSKKEQIVLWKTPLKVESWNTAEFRLEVPGIRENHPYLEIGDLVHMREVLVEQQKGSGRAVEGRVVALRKREGLVHISSPPLREHLQTYGHSTKTENGWYVFSPEDDIPLKFNVTFMMNGRPLCLMESAVATLSTMLNHEVKRTHLARQWLFPYPQDYLLSLPRKLVEATKIREDDWVDSGLNDEQRMAVSAVALYESPIPHLISGPPGTGKTRTVVEAVHQILRVQPEACILVCAPSNPATDTLVLRLQERLGQPEMLRLNNPHRTFAEVPTSIAHYCYVENNVFSIPPWKKLMQYRVVVCSCLDASILVGAQCTNSTLMALEEETMAAIHPHRESKHIAQPHWTHLLIDEAAQGSEPELLIPISVVIPHASHLQTFGTLRSSFTPQLALCGDVNQLGPLIASDEARAAEFEVSLLERLFERPLYSDFSRLLDSPEFVQPNGINGHLASPTLLPPYTRLVKNYRSHPAILMPPSTIFYNDTLEPCAKNGVISWKGLSNSKIPLKFIGDDSPENTENERASWFNPGQVIKVAEVIKSLLAESQACEPPLKPEEIGVMAPWRDQVLKLREKLRQEGLRDVDVGTIEDYQGREIRVVIISCVRSNARFLDEDRENGLGLVLERKRMNVAITRAKELLVVIGNAALLSQHDPYWKGFLQFALRQKLYEGPELDLEMDGNYISRLESGLLLSQDGSGLDAEEQGVAVAGVVAREVLRD